MKKIQYVFEVRYKSCAEPASWVRPTQFVHDNDRNPVAIAGEIITRQYVLTETGIRLQFLGLRAEGETEITECNPFVMTIHRSTAQIR